jgi:hypothetical protein
MTESKYIDPEQIKLEFYPFLQQIDTWKELPDDVQERLGNDLNMVKQLLENKGVGDVSEERYEALMQIAESSWPKPLKNMLTIAIGAFGALAIGTALGSFGDSTGRNPIQVGVSAITGGIFAVLTDKYLEGYLTKRQMRRYALDAIAQIDEKSKS